MNVTSLEIVVYQKKKNIYIKKIGKTRNFLVTLILTHKHLFFFAYMYNEIFKRFVYIFNGLI